jgi:hypothetical protein
MKTYSTLEAARIVGVHKQTLLGWMYDGKVAEPRRDSVGGQVVRIWTGKDVEKAKAYKAENYCKGRGRKKKSSKI